MSLEPLEQRFLLTVPTVMSISRQVPPSPNTAGNNVTYRVIFSEAVTGVDASDFRVVAAGNLNYAPPLVVSGSGLFYTVKVNGLVGSGELRLDLIDDDTIQNGTADPLGGPGLANGSFQGPSYSVRQIAPFVQSIARVGGASLPLGATSAQFTVTFSEPVTAVDPSDFALVLGGGVAVGQPLGVAGGGAVYTVTVSGISGSGTLGLNLVDDRSIVDADGNRLVTAGATPTFSAQVSPAIGPVPISVTAADLNADSKPDLVVANFFGANVSVLMGNGDGTFQGQVTYPTGVDPNSVVARDVNGDARPDLIVANYIDGTVSVLLGNGDGTFQGQVTYPVLVNPVSLAVSDVSRDGRPDLIVANRGSNSLSVLLGNGDGTFQPHVPYAVGTNPQSVSVGDFNFDGKLDLVVANSGSNTVSVLLGNGDGTFGAQTPFATGTNPQSVVATDVNFDAYPDLAVANFGSNTVGVLLGNGDGTFQAQIAAPVGAQPQTVVAADTNLDGKVDLLVANSNENTLGVLLGNGDGTFNPQSTSATGATPYSVAALDLNADGRLDLVSANLFGSGLTVLTGSSTGNFTGEVYTVLPAMVVDRKLFYLNSPAFDVTNAQMPGFSHDNAIAPDKTAYLPGSGLAVFANVSSYSRGINGIMIDLLGPGSHASIGVNDFVFKVGNNNTPSSWAAAPVPSAITVRPGAGTSGADRIEVMWANGAIVNSWLEVQVLPTAATGMTSPHVFFWGNKVGDIGSPTATEFTVTAAGDLATISASGFGPAGGITNPLDIDRDNVITASGDRNFVAANIGSITRLTVGTGGPFAPGDEGAGAATPDLGALVASHGNAIASAVAGLATVGEPQPVADAAAVSAPAASAAPLTSDLSAASTSGPTATWQMLIEDALGTGELALDEDWLDALFESADGSG